MNKIIWSVWRDPLRPMVDRWGREVAKRHPEADDEHDPALMRARATFDGDDEFVVESPFDTGRDAGNLGPCVMGPFGMVPLLESNLPSSLFNFWVGDTNFGLTEELAEAIEAVPGVEAIDVYTPYRFRIAIGRAFEQGSVKAAIDRAVQPPPPVAAAQQPPAQPLDPLAALKRLLARAHKHWAIAVTPSGEYHSVGGDTVEEVRGKLERYAGARVVASWGTA